MDDFTARRIRAWRAEWRRSTKLDAADLDELAEHLAATIEALLAEGLDPEEAVGRAIARLGSPDEIDHEFAKVDKRPGRFGGPFLDLRFALRQLAAHPFFSFVAAASIAVAIASNTLVFSVVNAFLLRDQGFGESERLVEVYTGEIDDPSTQSVASWPMVDDLRDRFGGLFEGVVGHEPLFGRVRMAGTYTPAFGEIVDPEFFDVLGVAPAIGRTFTDEDRRLERGVAVISWDTWQNRLEGRPEALGTEIDINGEVLIIVGVAPADFRGATPGLSKQVWAPRWVLPLGGDEPAAGEVAPDANRERWLTQIKARLRPGVSATQAEVELRARAAELAADWPESYDAVRFRVLPTDDVALSPAVDRVAFPMAAGVMAIVLIVLLVASMNLAGFLLARGADRRAELELRQALGATRARLVGQLFIESLVLAGIGGVAGLALTWAALQAFLRIELPIPIPLDFDFSIDGTVLVFTLAVTLTAAMLFGLLPALRSTRDGGARRATRGGRGSTGTGRVRSTILAVQVAVSLVFLVAGGLFARSFRAEARIDPGFRTSDAAILTLELASGGYGIERLPELLTGLRAEAGRRSELAGVAFTSRVPMGSVTSTVAVDLPDGGEGPVDVQDFIVSPDYFEVLGVSVVEGRGFGPGDGRDDAGVVVVSRSFAERFEALGGALGRSIVIDGRPTEVVGIVEDVRVDRPREAANPHLYRPLAQTGAFLLSVVGLASGSSGEALLALRAALNAVDPDVMVWGAATMEDHLSVKLMGARIAAGLLGGSALTALLLTLVGVFGSVRYTAARRAPEMAIRLSLGAPPASLTRLLVGSMVRVILVGGAAGLALSLIAMPVLRGLLFGVPDFDVWTFAGAVSALAGLAALAAWLPTRRIGRIDLTSVLKEA